MRAQMKLDDERVSMIVHAMGRAVMDLSLSKLPMTQEAIIDKLERYRKQAMLSARVLTGMLLNTKERKQGRKVGKKTGAMAGLFI